MRHPARVFLVEESLEHRRPMALPTEASDQELHAIFDEDITGPMENP